jgi:LemA protein
VKKILITILAVLAVGIALRLPFASSREALALQRAAVGDSWNAVDAALREHADLLPALTAKVQVAPKLQAQALQTIAEARGVLERAQAAPEKIQAYQRLSRESARLLLAAEQNAGLRTDKDFKLLKEQLTGTDNRIMVARRKYNEALERYNASLAVFPHNVVAAISGFSRDDAYFPTGLESRPSTKE